MVVFLVAAGAIALTALIPQAKPSLRQVPLAPIIVAVGLVLAEGLRQAEAGDEIRYHLDPGAEDGGDLSQAKISGVTLVKKKKSDSF